MWCDGTCSNSRLWPYLAPYFFNKMSAERQMLRLVQDAHDIDIPGEVRVRWRPGADDAEPIGTHVIDRLWEW